MRRPFLSAFFLLALTLTACDPLEKLVADTCGNGVVDRFTDENGVEQGEDCDSLEVDGFRCRSADQTWACSFSCNADGSCPAGYGCGTDSVCRKATGFFEADAFASGPSQAQELFAGDFDADGVADVVGVEPGRLRITFAGSTGAMQQVFLPAKGRPTIGKLGGLTTGESAIDTTEDLMLALDVGLGALMSNGDRTFSPKTYASITFGDLGQSPAGPVRATEALPMAFDALPDAKNHPGDETVALFAVTLGGKEQADGEFGNFSTVGNGEVFAVKDAKPSTLTGPPVTANFDGDPCLEVVFPHSGTKGASGNDILSIYKACVPGNKPGEWEWRPANSPQSPIVADIDTGGKVNGPAFAYDVNSDGNLDLLISVGTEKSWHLQLAYSLGNGQFASEDPALGNPVVADNRAQLYAVLDDVPLALGRLNKDAYPDVVQPAKVRLGTPKAGGQLDFADAYTSPRRWSEALIADVNADGRPDVVASTKGAANIDVVNNTDTAYWNPLTLSTDGTVAHLATGDFDGDMVSDIVFQDVLSSNESLLTISYGRPTGGPEAPVEIGTLPNVSALSTGNVLSFGVDAITDLGVISTNDTTSDLELSLSFFPGAASRVMQTPYLLVDKDTHVHIPIQTGLGFLHEWTKGSNEEAHHDVAAIAFDPPSGPNPSLTQLLSSMHLWGLSGAGEATFSAVTTVKCSLPVGAFYLPPIKDATSVLLSDVPIGQASEVFVVTPFISLDAGGAVLGVSELVASADFSTDGTCTFADPGNPQHTKPGMLLFRTRLVDLNGNGKPEMLAIQSEYSATDLAALLNPAGGSTGTGKTRSKLVVFWDGDLGTAEILEPDEPADQPEFVSGYTVGDVTGDGKPEVIVVGSGPPATYRVADSGAALEVTDTPQRLDLADVRAVLLADADGDGVKDMCVASGSRLEIHRGVAKKEAHADTVSSGTGQ